LFVEKNRIIFEKMIAKILKPVYPLSKFVDSIYCYCGTSDGMIQQLIPDGKTDLLLNFGTSIYIFDEKNQRKSLTESIFQGIRKRPYTFEFGKSLNIVGIRFLPLGFSSLFKIREKDISDNPVTAELIAGRAIKEIEERVYEEDDLTGKLKIIERWLFEYFAKRDNSNIIAATALDELNVSKGLLKIKDAGRDEAGYKRLQRTFRDYIGISPKLYSRMLRFESIHNELRRMKETDWMNIVAKYNFYDQPHLIKEFKFFTGITPNEFISKIDKFV
jgi:AraC-like DNA-binding protein